MNLVNKAGSVVTNIGLFLTASAVMVITLGFGGMGYRRALDRWHFKAVVDRDCGGCTKL